MGLIERECIFLGMDAFVTMRHVKRKVQ